MILKVAAATKSFGKMKILRSANLQLASGEIVGLFGRNGSGKSTLLKMIFGKQKADSIDLSIDDKPYLPKKIIPRQLIAYLPQEHFLPTRVSVRKIITLCYAHSPEILDRIFYSPGIHEIEEILVGKLSQGQAKYLELLLIAYLNHPFLLLDEPFSMVDPKYVELIQELLLQLKPSKGILLTDHYYKNVLSVTDRNYLLKDGYINTVSGKEELKVNGYLKSL